MRDRPARWVSLVATAMKVATLGVLLVLLGSALVVPASAPEEPTQTRPVEASSRWMERTLRAYDCSTTGFGPGTTPATALVRRGGRVQVVSFDEGWSVFTGDRRGTLLAVCRNEVRV